MKQKPQVSSVAVKQPIATQKPIAKKAKAPDALIRDWDFSGVTKTNARVVWIYEIARQSTANYLAGLSDYDRAWGIHLGELRKPYTAINRQELEKFDLYTNDQFKPFWDPKGGVGIRDALGKYFGEVEPTSPQYSDLRFTIEINPFLRPINARKCLLHWFELKVIPKLWYPEQRRGPKPNHISWIADLAIYRASKAGVRFGQMKHEVRQYLPKGFKADSLFDSRTHQTGAKKRTQERTDEVFKKGLQFSKWGFLS